MVSVGAEYKFMGEFVNNAKHGKQFAFTDIVLMPPDSEEKHPDSDPCVLIEVGPSAPPIGVCDCVPPEVLCSGAPVAAIVSICFFPHTQARSRLPAAVALAAFVTVHSPNA